MMYGGFNSMMGNIGVFGLFTWLVFFIDLILVGVWLWQNISKNSK